MWTYPLSSLSYTLHTICIVVVACLSMSPSRLCHLRPPSGVCVREGAPRPPARRAVAIMLLAPHLCQGPFLPFAIPPFGSCTVCSLRCSFSFKTLGSILWWCVLTCYLGWWCTVSSWYLICCTLFARYHSGTLFSFPCVCPRAVPSLASLPFSFSFLAPSLPGAPPPDPLLSALSPTYYCSLCHHSLSPPHIGDLAPTLSLF